ncbi:hypothetical protein ACH473_10630 [Cellulosimicrobium funkei]
MSRRLQTALELCGFVLLVIGLALWSVPAALVAAGAGLVLAGNVKGGER